MHEHLLSKIWQETLDDFNDFYSKRKEGATSNTDIEDEAMANFFKQFFTRRPCRWYYSIP